MPIFSHDEKDLQTFRMITAQFCVQGSARQVEICKAFGVPAVTMKRAVKRYREEELPAGDATLYVDGHVRVYNGDQTKLPRKYVARQRLCLRGVTDYWVNAMDGQPFFVVTKEVDSGLLKVLSEEIVPRLELDVPNQPTSQELASDPWLHRFVIVFDRAGYSPDFFRKMWEKRIACITYHKNPGEAWDEVEFTDRQVTLQSGDVVQMKIAERGTFLAGEIWVREIRKLGAGGHQTAVISTL